MNEQLCFVDAKHICAMLGICRSKWWYITNAGHKYCDENAPRGFVVGRRSRRWRLVEVMEWAQRNHMPWGTN
jgi:predicted DNA-binding transcriptional regulator AlpA